jgi:hypothetical protein
MSRVLDLREIIRGLLLTAHPRVYYENAPKSAQMPYLVFDLPSSFDDGDTEVFVLDVDGWDSPTNGDTTALETLMEAADAALQRAVINQDGIAAPIYRDSRLSLNEQDERIVRRKYTYQVRCQ